MVRQTGPLFETPQTAPLERRIHVLEARVAMLERRLEALSAGRGYGAGSAGGINGRVPARGDDPPRPGASHRSRPLTPRQHDAATTAARVALAAARASAAARAATAAARFAQEHGGDVFSMRMRPADGPVR